MAAYNGFMGEPKGLPDKCPECNVHGKEYTNWEWEQQEWDDQGAHQFATCPECKTKFVEYLEPVDWEKIWGLIKPTRIVVNVISGSDVLKKEIKIYHSWSHD